MMGWGGGEEWERRKGCRHTEMGLWEASWEVGPVVDDPERGGLTVRRWRWEGFCGWEFGVVGLLRGGGVVLGDREGVLRISVKRLLSKGNSEGLPAWEL